MVQATRAYADGNFDVRMQETGSGEIGELATAFNAMADSLQETERQRYNVQAGAIEHEQVKFRATVLRKSTEKGTIETGNPYGSTEKFSVLRYEEIVDGETVMLIDAMAGIIMVNGVNYTDPVENLLK